ncbi:hypothetical protein COCSADRAFT_352782 [Bipolaris sorokiniana ND90Pr]|uniref:Uncharacterized protein n=1 Tax=Cochliobolus sativus (strain ND90Pr / ATCC 201652) TaxID=665912 RepID=M2TGC1_COCSN|nr:uncharacterized protein COCSADRAFT_352782 [Bipolaris sorokiniana ND90Pr]EMD67777.1 hypothetical protein COCSADRAFT_352782 [Bipolaris sorokiniana ND90Pr]
MPCPCTLTRFWTSLDPAAQSVHILHANPNLTLKPLVIHRALSAKPLRVMRRQSKVHLSHQPGAPPASLTNPSLCSTATATAIATAAATTTTLTTSYQYYWPTVHIPLSPPSPQSTLPQPRTVPDPRASAQPVPVSAPPWGHACQPWPRCSGCILLSLSLTLELTLGHLRTMCSRAQSRSRSPRCASLTRVCRRLLLPPLALLIRRRPLLYAGRRRPPFSSSSPAPMSISPPTAVSASPPGPQRCRMARVSRPASPAAAVQEREAYAALTPGPAAAESWHASLASPMDGAVGARGLC